MDQTENKPYGIAELNRFFQDGEACDQEVFAEQRSNVLLVSGEHYNKRRTNLLRRLRDMKDITQEQKLRITKNHVQKVCNIYSNNILSMAPGVGFSPKVESELSNQKAAELHHSVWRDGVERYCIDDMMDDWCDNFVQIGEVALKIFFDPTGGDVKAYEQLLDEAGEPVFDEMGNPAPDENRPVFKGAFDFETIEGFNLIRPAECKDMRKAEWLCLRKMVSIDILKEKFGQDPEKAKLITSSADETYVVFEATRGGYRKTDKECLVREFYFRPGPRYPRGYYFITVKEGVLSEGELPGGIFPIVFQPFNKISTSPRGRGPIKTMRPYQAEINRASSKVAEHHITLGDDKLILQNGSKVSPGMALPGVRTISVTGQEPKIMPGRDGNQFVDYIDRQIKEMYVVMNVAEDSEELQGNIDPYVLLFRSARQKKKFQRYIRRFERFLIEVAKTYLKLAKLYLDEDEVIFAVGKQERVNIPEFKNSDDIGYEIKIEAQSDDIDTKMGKQLMINHALQYVGTQLSREDIGKIMRESPIADFDGAFDDMTLDYDLATNAILAMDRGEKPPVHESDNHKYMIRRLLHRTQQADFPFLQPEIQQAYQARLGVHQQFEAMNQLKIQQAEAGFIPTGGYLVKCDFYVPSAADSTKKERLTLPADAIAWLVERLEAQGAGLEGLQPPEAQVGVADRMIQAQAGQPGPTQGAPDGMGQFPQ